MTPFETVFCTVIFVAALIWMSRSLWKRILPAPVWATIETTGVLAGLCIAMFGGAGGNVNVGSTSGYTGPHISHSDYRSLGQQWRSPEFRNRSSNHYSHSQHGHNYDNHTQNYHSHHSKKATKRNVSETLKKVVAANQSWRCGDCKHLLSASYEIDHFVPLADGGSNDASNLIALCRDCHGDKSIRDRLRWNGEL